MAGLLSRGASGLASGLGSRMAGRAVRRGLMGGHPAWRVVLVAVGLVRLLRFRGAGRPTVLREELAPGESLVVRHLPDSASDGDA